MPLAAFCRRQGEEEENANIIFPQNFVTLLYKCCLENDYRSESTSSLAASFSVIPCQARLSQTR